ncbi:hypothetical protein GIB67_017859 [Kingdonia uniflora]|uniref:DNA-directed RNA polymerase III subunit RPC3 n=1 Tax=Kingdonia uniflora TaxID=39325 RepID=A0A7J7ML25_9MAGN|nr:hypothetical protein GIB67_017859 [Kingdonia uniflora]
MSLISSFLQKVCDCLLRKGTLSLQDITRYAELPSKVVENCLLVLIQHNCVQASNTLLEGGFGVAPRAVTQYVIIFENILHRLRFSKFLSIVSEQHSAECVELLKVLFQHGRLTLEQILSKKNQGMLVDFPGNPKAQDALRASFGGLVEAHYIERCPTSEPYLAPFSEDNSLSTRTRGPKSAKLTGEIEAKEQGAIIAATPSETDRFSFIADIGNDVVSEAETGRNPANILAGEKRKHDSVDMNTKTSAVVCEKKILWRANFEEFVRRLRHKACVANVRTRLDGEAATILNAVLEVTWRAYRKVKTENSVPLSVEAILEEVMRSEGRIMTLEHVRAALDVLGCRPSTRGTDESYSIDLKNIIEIAQNDEAESIVLKRYGRNAYRVFRFLAKAGCLVHADKISDGTFIEKKETLKILYDLWKDDYLNMEKITIQGSLQPQFLLWEVNRRSLRELIFDEMYHAAINLSQRRDYEHEQERKLPLEKQAGAQGKICVLESSLMKLDDALMLFHDF